MTKLIVNLYDVFGELEPGDLDDKPNNRVVVWAPAHRSGPNGGVVHTGKRHIKLVNGKGEREVVPGPLMVKIQCGGVVDTKERQVVIPDDVESITLAEVLEGAFTYTPAVVSRVARDAADAAAAAARVEGVIDSTEWEGDQLRVLGELSPPLTGPAPELTISPGGTWVVDGVDTGHPAQGDKGDTPVLEVSAAGTWVIDGQDTGSPARGPEGHTPTVEGGTWHVGGVDTGYPASVGLVEDPPGSGLFIPETVDMSQAEVGVGDVAGLSSALAGKSDVGHKHPVSDVSATGTRSASTFLRGDGSWSTPPDTTYSLPTQSEAQAGTSTTARVWSAERVAQAVAASAAPADHSHTPQEIGAAPAVHEHTPQEIGAAPAVHEHTPQEIGAAPAVHEHGMGQITGLDTALDGKAPTPVEVTGDNWPTTGVPGTIYWQEEES